MSGRVEPEQVVTSACPNCGAVAERVAYDIGSGAELACADCEWCWGANGQVLKPVDSQRALDFLDAVERRIEGWENPPPG